MSKTVPALAAAAALTLDAGAQQNKDPYAALTPPPQPGHVIQLAQAGPAQPIYIVPAPAAPVNPNTIGALTPDQEKIFATAMARIHPAHVDSYVATSRSNDLKAVFAAANGGNVNGVINKHHFAANENSIRADKTGELAAAHLKEGKFREEFDKLPTKFDQFKVITKYLTELDAATACLVTDNAAKAARLGTVMKSDQVTKYETDSQALDAGRRQVYGEPPPQPKAPKQKHP